VDELLGEQQGVLSVGQARDLGVTPAALKWARRKGQLHFLRRGVFTSTSTWENASAEGRHFLATLAQQRVHPAMVACATSAAVLLELPTPNGPPEQPQLTVARAATGSGGRGNRAGALSRRSWLAAEEIVTLPSQVKVTSPVRTVLDCAREWDEAWGLAAADAALKRLQIQPTALLSGAEARPSIPGQLRSRWVAEHAREQVESPLESLARAVIVRAGFPEPTPQVWVHTAKGWFRVDLMDEANRLITEADGKLKYATATTLWEEKKREDALRDADHEVIRFTMSDHHNPAPWLRRYSLAMERAQHRLRS